MAPSVFHRSQLPYIWRCRGTLPAALCMHQVSWGSWGLYLYSEKLSRQYAITSLIYIPSPRAGPGLPPYNFMGPKILWAMVAIVPVNYRIEPTIVGERGGGWCRGPPPFYSWAPPLYSIVGAMDRARTTGKHSPLLELLWSRPSFI